VSALTHRGKIDEHGGRRQCSGSCQPKRGSLQATTQHTRDFDIESPGADAMWACVGSQKLSAHVGGGPIRMGRARLRQTIC